MGQDIRNAELADAKAMSRTVPPEPEAVTEPRPYLGGGGRADREAGRGAGEAVGRDREAAGQPERQRRQELVQRQHEPAETHAEEEVLGGRVRGPSSPL